MGQNKFEANYFWDNEEKKAYVQAGGGWDGIEAVIELDLRRFYGK